MCRLGCRSQRGQASVEHVGLITLLALVLAALAIVAPVSGIGDTVASAIAGSFAGESARGGPLDSGAAAGSPASRPPDGSWARSRAIVDRLVAAGLAEFLAYRASVERDPRLDYSTDLCSAPLVGSSGASFDFTEACLRHDFGYRNYDRLGIIERRKDAVDDRFLADMRDHCASRPPEDRTRCLTWARVFYEAVHRLGGLSGHGG